MNKKLHAQTIAIRGARTNSQYNEHSSAMYFSSSFTFENAQQAHALFLGELDGYTYSRTANPTVDAFASRVAQLEYAEAGLATSSGMAAAQATFLSLLKSGDHIIASKNLFGSNTSLVNTLPNHGIAIDFVASTDIDAWEKLVRPNTKMFFLETPSNPLLNLLDIEALSNVAHKHNALLVVDNTFCTSALQQPLKLGADISIQSATKGIDGQGRAIGGVICGSKNLIEELHVYVRTAGQVLSPFNAWVLMSGLETLFVRMQKQCETAYALALWLQNLPQIKHVYYPFLENHPQYELAKKQQAYGGVVLSIAINGGQKEAWKFIDSLQLFSRTSNLGDVKSTATHPYTTTHVRVPNEEKDASGITDNIVRLSIGLEHIDDLKDDLQNALNQCTL